MVSSPVLFYLTTADVTQLGSFSKHLRTLLAGQRPSRVGREHVASAKALAFIVEELKITLFCRSRIRSQRERVMKRLATLLLLAFFLSSAHYAHAQQYDAIVRNGMVYDGTGQPPLKADIGIKGDHITRVGNLSAAHAMVEVDAKGRAVAPGFINMMSGEETLFADGRSQSDIRQGVTLEIFGEGESMGPHDAELTKYFQARQGDIKYPLTWTTLAEGLDTLVKHGVSCNVASFVGAATIRENVLGFANRAPNADELARMQQLTAQAMKEGALGVASALIYAPGAYAKTDEIVALTKVAAQYGGIYISHMRSEGNQLVEAVDELISIARPAKAHAEIYHLKAAGKNNWGKMDEVIKHVEAARAQGLGVTADMYTYDAGATGLDAAMPPWVQEGGYGAWAKRLQDPATRKRVSEEMRTPTDKWENWLLASGSPDRVLLVSFKNDALKPLTGKTLAEVAKMRGKSPEETAMDLVIEDGSRVGTIYFVINEDNIRKQLKLPWVSFGSDEDSQAPEGIFLKSNPHPRAYGNFARLLGKYVRDEKLVPLPEAIRRLAYLPAQNLSLDHRGLLKEGYFADVVVFDPATIQDHATYTKPHQYSTGVSDVFVNGVQVLKNGEHTGAKPGRVLYGPGRKQ
jgi:N-acyl-D-amino-acid deacylase